MPCSGAYATRDEYSEWWGYYQHKIDLATLTPAELAALDNQLLMAAGDIHVALAQVGACDCSLSGESTQYLKKLNIISTAVVYRAPCGPRLTDDERRTWMEWLDGQLKSIREGDLELCAGATGKNYPAFDAAQPANTEFSERDLIINAVKRRQP